MKNKKLLFLIFILFTSFVFAKKEAKKVVIVENHWSVGVFGSYFKSNDFENGSSFGLMVTKNLSKNFDLELRVSHGTIETKANNKIDEGKFTLTPIQLGVNYNFLFDKFRPYLSVGAGYYMLSFKNDTLNDYGQYGFTIKNKVDNKIGFHAALGLNYLITSKLIVNLDVRYVVLDFNGSYEMQDNYSQVTRKGDYDGDLSHMELSLGFKMFL